MTMIDLPPGWEPQPICARCRQRHRLDVKCWYGKHARDVTRRTLVLARRAQPDARAAAVCWLQLDARCTVEATTTDHVQPRSYGGGDEPSNCRPACAHCNSLRRNDPNPFKPEPAARPTGVGLSPRWRTT